MTSVKLIAVTQPINVPGVSGPEELIAYTARVSNPANQNNSATAQKLLRYLMDNQHWSPFEMVHAVLEINTTRDIARQILRHRSFSFQEFSQRYAEVTSLGWELGEARLQDAKNRQNSIKTSDDELKALWADYQQNVVRVVEDAYEWALTHGIAKECARKVLPEGITMSRLYMAGTLRSWLHYCALRRSNGTQLEHMQVADQCWEALYPHFPSLMSEINVK